MEFKLILFYVLSAILVGSSLAVITARNPVVAAMFLVPMLYIYAKRDPDPRRRPTRGQLAFAGLFSLLVCGVISQLLTSLAGTSPDWGWNDDLPPGSDPRNEVIDSARDAR